MNSSAFKWRPGYSLAIIHTGGPAPPSAGVTEGAVKAAEVQGIPIFGIRWGWRDLRRSERHDLLPGQMIRLTSAGVDGLSRLGGTFPLPTYRANLATDEQAARAVVAACRKLGIGGLIVSGGEDGGSSAASVGRAALQISLEENIDLPLGVVQTDKTVDNDFPAGDGYSTYGPATFSHYAGEALRGCFLETLSAPNRVMLARIMGRLAGFLACSSAQHMRGQLEPDLSLMQRFDPLMSSSALLPAVTLTPEVLAPVRKRIALSTALRLITGGTIKYYADFNRGGVVLISEGILEACSDDSVRELIAGAPCDENGHLQHSKIPFADVGAKLLEDSFKRIGFLDQEGKPLKATGIDIGYGNPRCGRPVEEDRSHALAVGEAAVRCLAEGRQGGTLCWHPRSGVKFLSFAETVDPQTNRIPSRFMPVSDFRHLVVDGRIPFLTNADLQDAARCAQLAALTKLAPAAFAEYFCAAADAVQHVVEAL